MKIKKFICDSCGAPKINPYKSPYIVCDFCGSFVDIDLTVSLQAWYNDPERGAKFEKENKRIQKELPALVKSNDREGYFKLQLTYWDLYHRLYPEYLPPTIHLDDNHYAAYLEICADATTSNQFDEYYQEVINRQNDDVQKLQYYSEGNNVKVHTKGFFNMVTRHLEVQTEFMKTFYANPKYALMHQLLPHGPHLKMKISNLVQAWIPYLSEKDADTLVEITGFKSDYIDVPSVPVEERACQFCKADLPVCEGAIKVYCESCHRINAIQSVFNCSGCGGQNHIPTIPKGTINCTSCGIENRLVKRNFG